MNNEKLNLIGENLEEIFKDGNLSDVSKIVGVGEGSLEALSDTSKLLGQPDEIQGSALASPIEDVTKTNENYVGIPAYNSSVPFEPNVPVDESLGKVNPDPVIANATAFMNTEIPSNEYVSPVEKNVETIYVEPIQQQVVEKNVEPIGEVYPQPATPEMYPPVQLNTEKEVVPSIQPQEEINHEEQKVNRNTIDNDYNIMKEQINKGINLINSAMEEYERKTKKAEENNIEVPFEQTVEPVVSSESTFAPVNDQPVAPITEKTFPTNEFAAENVNSVDPSVEPTVGFESAFVPVNNQTVKEEQIFPVLGQEEPVKEPTYNLENPVYTPYGPNIMP